MNLLASLLAAQGTKNIQTSNREGDHQAYFHILASLQFPNRGHRQHNHCDVRGNIRNAAPDEECLLINAFSTRKSEVPIRFEGAAGRQAHNKI